MSITIKIGVLSLLLIGQGLKGQSTFNQRLMIGLTSFKSHSIYSSNDRIYVYSLEWSGPRHLCSSIHTMDGELIDSLFILGEWGPSGVSVLNDGFSENEMHIQGGTQFNWEGIGGAYYQIYSEIGEPIRFNAFINPWWSGNLQDTQTQVMVPNDWHLDQEGNVLFSYSGDAGADGVVDCGVIYFNAEDEYQWHLEWIGPLIERIYAITKLEDHYYLALERWNDEFVVNNDILIYKVTESGEIVDEWIEPWSFNMTDVNEMLTDGNDLILVGASIDEDGNPSDATIIKVDAEMQLIWSQNIDNTLENYRRQFEDITITTDGNYVVSGQYPYDLEEPDPINGDYMDDGWLAKFDSQTGDLMWERFYRIVESTDKLHTIFDLKATPDGGVAFCGESADFTDDWTDENPLQQGWLVKVDEFGCLVPGCQNVGVAEFGADEDAFSFGPNPLPRGRALNVFNARDLAKDARYELWSADGQLIASMTAGYAGLTTFWSLPELSSGVYLLQLVEGGKVVQSSKLVVE